LSYLFDFRLGFFSSMGFAEAIPSPGGDSMHGLSIVSQKRKCLS
jgi:hypothetical protein